MRLTQNLIRTAEGLKEVAPDLLLQLKQGKYKGHHDIRSDGDYEELFEEGVEQGWIDIEKIKKTGTLKHINKFGSYEFQRRLEETGAFQQIVAEGRKLPEQPSEFPKFRGMIHLKDFGMSRAYTETQERTIYDLKSQGVKWKDIGAAIGKTASAARNRYQRLTGRRK